MNSDINRQAYDIRRKHYEVEKALASRLKQASRAERPEIYKTMYQELLEQVPEHARFSKTVSSGEVEIGLRRQKRLIERYLNKGLEFVEFAPGTCRLSYMIAGEVKSVVAVDISDQRLRGDRDIPHNFTHLIYDGYSLDMPSQSIDLVFSNQFIEHIHPDDVLLHFQLVCRLLRPSGRYIFSTPHLFVGPGDVSRGFSDIAEGFHLKEWTYKELDEFLQAAGFTKTTIMIWIKGHPQVIPFKYLYFILEKIFSKFEIKVRRKLSRYLFTQILFVAEK